MKRAVQNLLPFLLLIVPLLALALLAGCQPIAARDVAVIDEEFAAAEQRYAELVEAAELPDVQEQPIDVEVVVCRCMDGGPTRGGRCECVPSGAACICGPKPEHAVFERYESPCVLVFSGPNCAPCVTAVNVFVPRLQKNGWNVYVIDQEQDPAAWATCGVDEKPAFVCVRRGMECGRLVGADWSALCAMLREALSLQFPK